MAAEESLGDPAGGQKTGAIYAAAAKQAKLQERQQLRERPQLWQVLKHRSWSRRMGAWLKVLTMTVLPNSLEM